MAAMAGRNSNARGRDMLISMAVLLVPVALIVWFFSRPGDTTVQAVSVAPVLQKAKAASPYPVLVPEALDAEWTATRVAWAASGDKWIDGEPAEGNSWQVGYMSPEGIYFGVQQRDEALRSFVSGVTRDGSGLRAEVDLAGRTWQRYESADRRTMSLVNVDGDVASIVTADTDFAELEAFASTLVAVDPAQG